MTRDYKHTGKKKKARKAVPGWLWLLTGLTVGLLVALLVYLDANRPTATQRAADRQAQLTKQEKKPVRPSSPRKQDDQKTQRAPLRYEFYTVLPESEVVVPEEELNQPAAGQADKSLDSAYMLQAGSFKHADEAESLKAQLALIGIESSIQRVTIGQDIWHRIRIGPFTSLREINQVRNRLRENQINAIPVKIKG